MSDAEPHPAAADPGAAGQHAGDPDIVEGAVIVPVPEAEPVVGAHRARLDQSAPWGVPAHVTVLYPFAAVRNAGDAAIAVLAAAIGQVRCFDCMFTGTGWFGEDVLWLAPEPDDPFRALTRAVAAAFPRYPPYGGSHADVVPHLTVGERALGGTGELRAVERQVLGALRRRPVRFRVSRAWLMTGSPRAASWQRIAELPLARH